MNKLEVLDYIKKHNKEYGGKLVTEKGFKKHFEELYNILQSMTFPSYSEKWDFKQKLWHFLRDDYTQHLCKCGGVKNGYNIGLYYNNELVEVMTFGGLRKSMGSNPISGHYEIYRVCSKLGYNIQGGFSKLLKHFENTYKPIQIITYANLDYTYGNVYNKTGFHKDKISKPTYTWVVNGQRKHRTNFRKNKLKECIDNPDLTEIEVMYNRNCWRCWDSGKIKFIKNY